MPIDWSWTLLGTTYVAVLASEMIGDRSLLAVGALAARWRPLPVFLGTLPAIAAKSLAAVVFGQFVSGLPPRLVAAVSATTFLAAAIAAWRERSDSVSPTDGAATWKHGATAGFLAIFLTEWADVGQLTTAALTARFGLPFIVWLGAVLALGTKSLIATSLGLSLRRYVSVRTLRFGATIVCAVLAILAAFRVD